MRYTLTPHPDAPPQSIQAVEVELLIDPGNDLRLRYRVMGASLLLPESQSPRRTDGLWQTTCFELFLRSPKSDAYFEFNFSPSSEWAAYAFDGYRAGGRAQAISVAPNVRRAPLAEQEGAQYVLEIDIGMSDLPDEAFLMGLAAVIEEEDGTKSYWALAHPPGAPDFHHKDCFARELPAARPA